MRLLLSGLAAAAALLAPGTLAAPARPAVAEPSAAQRILVMVRLPPDHFRPGGDYRGGYGGDSGSAARTGIARRIARTNHLLFLGDWPMPLIGLDCFVMDVPQGQDPAAAAERVARDRAVEWAQPLRLYRVQGTLPRYDDPLLPAEPALRAWRLTALHQLATGRGVTVAVIDSQVDVRHPDLAGQVAQSRDFVGTPAPAGAGEGHGTAVAGVIAARAGNGVGIVGVAPQARLLGLRACWEARTGTFCDSLSLAKALHYAIDRNAQVINLSLAGPDDRLLAMLVRLGIARGETVVAAYDAAMAGGGFPASLPGVVAVSDRRLAGTRGPVYTAPGRDIPTTEPGGRWDLVSGSSFAAAHVSGLVALVRERRPSARQVRLAVAPADGTIDACASLLLGSAGCDCACAAGRAHPQS